MKRSWLALFLCMVGLLVPSVLRAQGSPILAGLSISLWPEYDRAGVLVIYRGQFDAVDPFPLSIEISIPAEAGPPTAVAYVDSNGGRFNLQYTTRVEGDSMILSFDLPTPDFQIEYYDELPVSDAGVREYTFSYTADYPVRDLVFEVQEPPTAESFQLTPAADSSTVADDGLRYNQVEAGSLEQGETLSWTFQYTKQDDQLTTAFFQQASPPAETAQPAAAPQGNSTVAIFIVAFVALVGVGVAAYWLGQRTQAPASVHRSASTEGKVSLPRRKRDRDAYFCHKCGAEIRGDSHFCQSCGAAVRREQ